MAANSSIQAASTLVRPRLAFDEIPTGQAQTGLFAAGRVLSRAPSRDLLLKTPMGKVLMLTPLPKLTWAQMEAALDILDEALADEARA